MGHRNKKVLSRILNFSFLGNFLIEYNALENTAIIKPCAAGVMQRTGFTSIQWMIRPLCLCQRPVLYRRVMMTDSVNVMVVVR